MVMLGRSAASNTGEPTRPSSRWMTDPPRQPGGPPPHGDERVAEALDATDLAPGLRLPGALGLGQAPRQDGPRAGFRSTRCRPEGARAQVEPDHPCVTGPGGEHVGPAMHEVPATNGPGCL